MAALVSTAEEAPAPSLDELRSRRGVIRFREEDLFRLADHNRAGYVVLGVHADWERQSVLLMVCHPDLPPIASGELPTVLDVQAQQLVEEFRVIDDQLWRRCRLALDDPRVQAASE